ncbi:MAG: peptide deformylase [Candidatus Paceibacterota bacterium]
MIIKEITQIGDPILHQKSKFVTKINSEDIQRVIKNLIDSMRYHNLIGIAAPQIGENLRIFVTEVRKTKYRNLKKDKLRVYVNPEIVWLSKKEVLFDEGCGSVAYAQLFAPVKRPEKVEVKAFDENGNEFIFKADGMLSRVIQHELDHLNGIEFIEKVKDPKSYMSSGEHKKKMMK